MAGIEKKSFDSPDETRSPEKTNIQLLHLGGVSVGRATFEPGWRWSDHIKPVVGTESCQAHHVGAIISGRLHVKHEDGSEGEAGPGEAYVIEPGHDAWVVGDEPVVALEFDQKTAAEYAKGS